MYEYTAFVPNGENRKDTAILLVGTADEYGIDQRSIKAVSSGFWITDELAAVIGEEKSKKKTSGKRAEKNDSTEGE